VQTVETVAEKSAQVKSQVEQISGRFQELEKSVQEAHTTRVARDEPQVTVGGLLA
jgi:archaellum component FlaC